LACRGRRHSCCCDLVAYLTADVTIDAAVAAAGRLPTREAERVYSTYGSFLRTFTAFGSAVWVFMVGSALPAVGDTRLAVIGYACGLIFGIIPVLLSGALPSFRYGVDAIDFSKSFLGVRGAYLPLAGLLVTALGWASVVCAMVARGMGLLIALQGHEAAVADERLIIGLCFITIGLCWLLLRRGLSFIQRLNDFVGPGLIVLAIVSLILLCERFGVRHLWMTNVAPQDALTGDRRKGFAYAIELGIATSLAWWPFVGGLYRILKHRRDSIGPCVIGASVIGGAFCSGVAALASVNLGSADPLVWLLKLAGPTAGSLIVALILLMNIPTICMLVYFAAVSIQQIRSLARIRWSWLVALMLLPMVLVAFNTLWAVSHIITIATYGGLQFLGITAIGLVDYYVLRKQSMAVEQLFARGEGGQYWFWGGFNWIALMVIALGTLAYLDLYDPITLNAPTAFRYFGAGLPIMVASGLLYFILMRWCGVPTGRGGYGIAAQVAEPQSIDVEVGL
jgi:nucleobase:cation symporter-1, NCS1 family